MDELEREIHNFKAELKKLSEKEQHAIGWIICHIDIVEHVAQGDKLTEQELEAIMDEALKEENFLLLALALCKQAKDRAKNLK